MRDLLAVWVRSSLAAAKTMPAARIEAWLTGLLHMSEHVLVKSFLWSEEIGRWRQARSGSPEGHAVGINGLAQRVREGHKEGAPQSRRCRCGIHLRSRHDDQLM